MSHIRIVRVVSVIAFGVILSSILITLVGTGAKPYITRPLAPHEIERLRTVLGYALRDLHDLYHWRAGQGRSVAHEEATSARNHLDAFVALRGIPPPRRGRMTLRLTAGSDEGRDIVLVIPEDAK